MRVLRPAAPAKKALSCEGAFFVSMRSQSLDCGGGGFGACALSLASRWLPLATRLRSWAHFVLLAKWEVFAVAWRVCSVFRGKSEFCKFGLSKFGSYMSINFQRRGDVGMSRKLLRDVYVNAAFGAPRNECVP